MARRPPLRVTVSTRWPRSWPRSVTSAAASSSTRSPRCSSSRAAAAVRSRAGPGSASAAARNARAWSRSSPTVAVWSGSTRGRRTAAAGFAVSTSWVIEVAVEAGQRGEPAGGAGGGGAVVEEVADPQVHVHPPGGEDVDLEAVRSQSSQAARSQGVGAAGAGGAVAGQPRRGQQPLPRGQRGQRRVVGVELGQQRDRRGRRGRRGSRSLRHTAAVSAGLIAMPSAGVVTGGRLRRRPDNNGPRHRRSPTPTGGAST